MNLRHITPTLRRVALGVTLAAGLAACGSTSATGSKSSTTNPVAAPTAATVPNGSAPDGNGQNGPPPGGPGGGDPLVGDDYDKAVAAATAKYPGDVENAEKRADGTITVHVIAADGAETRVLEDANFKVTGTEAGRGGPGGPVGGPGDPLVGADYDKATAAATAKYPGDIQTAERRADGTIVVHVIAADGTETHVLEDANFSITGTEAGPGDRGGPRPGGAGSIPPPTT